MTDVETSMTAVRTSARESADTVSTLSGQINGTGTKNVVLGYGNPGGTNATVISSNSSVAKTYMKWTDNSTSAIQSVATGLSQGAKDTMWSGSMAFTYTQAPNRLVSTVKYGTHPGFCVTRSMRTSLRHYDSQPGRCQ